MQGGVHRSRSTWALNFLLVQGVVAYFSEDISTPMQGLGKVCVRSSGRVLETPNPKPEAPFLGM